MAAIPTPVLGDDDARGLEGYLSLAEIQDAVAKLHPGKTPGANGLPAEFYKRYTNILSPHLRRLFVDSHKEGILKPDLRMTTIVVIYKEGKSRNHCGSYRPISLLNSEVKSLATILATRLLGVVTALAHEDQSGFMPGCSTRLNLRQTHNWLMKVKTQTSPQAFLSLHPEKAFDAVDSLFLDPALAKFGFRPKFRS